MQLRFLGSADSAGIPVHNCTCNVCERFRKENEQNLATSAVLELDSGSILLDAGLESIATDFDGQTVYAVCLTHFHADHCLGLLRLRHSQNEIPCFHPKDKKGFSDLFKYPFSINYNELVAYKSFEIKEVKFTPIPLIHSRNTLGYIIEYQNTKVAYLTDCAGIEEKSLRYLQSIAFDYVFIDACYDERKIMGNHLNYIQATEILQSLTVKEGYLMHLSHTTQAYIEENNVKLKYPYVKKGEVFLFN